MDSNSYNVQFDGDYGTFSEAAKVAGYDSLNDALNNVYDKNGEKVDFSDRFDENWIWVPGSKGLKGYELAYNPEKLIEWSASEELELGGLNLVFLDGGLTSLHGQANVTFSSSEGSFDKKYNVNSFEASGAFSSLGVSKSNTTYTRLFPMGTDKQDIIDSYNGYFRFLGVGVSVVPVIGDFSLGIDGSYTVGVNRWGEEPRNSWTGVTFGSSAAKGIDSGLGGTITHYSDPDFPETKKQGNTWDYLRYFNRIYMLKHEFNK